MWVRTVVNTLINLEYVETVRLYRAVGKSALNLCFEGTDGELYTHAFPDEAQAEATFNNFQQWLDTGRTIAPEHADTSTTPINHQVFDFRRLSEDDEFLTNPDAPTPDRGVEP